MKTKMSKLALVVSALMMAGGAMAEGTDTSTMGATATIAPECAVGNGLGISLGILDMLNLSDATQSALPTTATSTFPAICTNGTNTPTFAYVSGNKLGTDGTAFRLKGTGATDEDYINYTLHPSVDASLTAIAMGAPETHPGFSANGVSQNLVLSAKILASDKRAKIVQAYTDTITITAGWTP